MITKLFAFINPVIMTPPYQKVPHERDFGGSEGWCYSIFMISYDICPAGVVTATLSPTLCFKNALPKGDSSEIFPSSGFASYIPTMVYFEVFSPFLIVTIEP